MQPASSDTLAWQTVPALLQQIQLPAFPAVQFSVLDYGAVPGSVQKCTQALQAAIEACAAAGGGKVVVPAGHYYSGGLTLRSHVNLHLEAGAVLEFSTDPDDYLPLVKTRWEGMELMNYAPMLYAYGEKNIALTGAGQLNGGASAADWWRWRGDARYGWQEGMPCQQDAGSRPALFAMGEQEVPLAERLFGKGCYLRPNLVQFYACEGVLVEGVTLRNAPMWALHLVACQQVTVQQLHIYNQGPSGDGCNPESCRNVVVRNCMFDVSHDAIALKSGRNREGRRLGLPCENVVIQHCNFVSGHGAVTLGSESSGGIRNIFVEACTMGSGDLYRALRIKTSSNRGGVIENIYLRNIQVKQLGRQLISVSMRYEDKGEHFPIIRHLYFRNITAEKVGEVALLLEGYPESPIQEVQLENIVVKEAAAACYLTEVQQLRLEGVVVNGQFVYAADF